VAAPPQADAVRSAETWFLEHGLPYFVDGVRAEVSRRISRPRLVVVSLVALAVGVAAGLGVGLLSGSVSVFLAASSGLYFTVYAVTDSTYRQQFFDKIMRELARVVGARICYRELRRTSTSPS